MKKDVECVTLGSYSDIGCYVARYNVDERVSKLHMHEFIQINYVVGGEAIHYINGKEHTVGSGDIFVIPPMVEHRIIKKENSTAEIFELEFAPEFVFKDNKGKGVDTAEDVIVNFAYISPFLVKKEDVKPKFTLGILIRRRVEEMLVEALDEYVSRKSSYEAMLSSIISRVLITVGREYEESVIDVGISQLFKAQKENISRAIEYINNNYFEPLTINEVANKYYISASYFKRLFKYFTSKTFVEYVTELRITNAVELLVKTDHTITDIAMNVGFNNVNHFNRVFKSKMGVSPLQYRNHNSRR